MTDREKAIRAVETCFDSWIDKHRNMGLDLHEVERLKHEAMEMLKEQEPIEPKVDVDEWRCRNCGHKLEHQELLGENVLFHEQYNYCPQCGRAVKWDETD